MKFLIKIKRVYDRPSDDDGCRILIDRLWPRGLSKQKAKLDLWMKEIAPSEELRKWFGHEPEKWNEFQVKYERELSNKIELINQLKRLEKEKRVLTLVYAAKDIDHNNAVALRALLETN